MADKILKSITFPGLSDKYIIPETTIDAVPTQGSVNAVQSGGVKSALDTLQAQIPQIDAVPTQGSNNAVSSGGVYNEFEDIKSDISRFDSDLYVNDIFAFKEVSFQNVNGTAHSATADRVECKIPTGCNFIIDFVSSNSLIGVQVHAYYSDGSHERLIAFSAQTYNNTFTASKEIESIGAYITADQPSSENVLSVMLNGGIVKGIRDNARAIDSKIDSLNINYIIPKSSLVSGSLQTQSMTVSANISCVAYLTKIPVDGGETIRIEAPDIAGVAYYKYRFGFYDSTGAYISQIASQTSNTVKVGTNVRFISFHVQGFNDSNSQVDFNVRDTFSATDAIKFVYADRYISAEDFATMDWVADNFEKIGTGGYIIDSGNIKHPLFSELVGTIKYNQSFCIYNGKYYSTDGSHIAEQDGSFNILRDVEINVGHGNSMQLGNNGKAYVSGWDDGKIYVVDLATLTVESEIILPISGYFSAVVDDLNDIAYILHRTSYPDTVANYTFSVYDIVNDSIISSRVVNAFGALQGCDYIDGRIIASYGLGQSTVPNGITVYNTTGDILNIFDLDIFTITELEGIAYNRGGDGIYVSLYDKSVYLIN